MLIRRVLIFRPPFYRISIHRAPIRRAPVFRTAIFRAPIPGCPRHPLLVSELPPQLRERALHSASPQRSPQSADRHWPRTQPPVLLPPRLPHPKCWHAVSSPPKDMRPARSAHRRRPPPNLPSARCALFSPIFQGAHPAS